MLFNSLAFPFFLIIVLSIYWLCLDNKVKYQNILLLIASYIFYGWWDWRFLFLILISSIIDFLSASQINKSTTNKSKKYFLAISIIANISFLLYFKYMNFFIESFIESFKLFGGSYDFSSINIILPVGISFYTFQTMSYTIDVYNSKIEPTKDIIAFFSYVSFFPQLVAGPIERSYNLIPQFLKKGHLAMSLLQKVSD